MIRIHKKKFDNFQFVIVKIKCYTTNTFREFNNDNNFRTFADHDYPIIYVNSSFNDHWMNTKDTFPIVIWLHANCHWFTRSVNRKYTIITVLLAMKLLIRFTIDPNECCSTWLQMKWMSVKQQIVKLFAFFNAFLIKSTCIKSGGKKKFRNLHIKINFFLKKKLRCKVGIFV